MTNYYSINHEAMKKERLRQEFISSIKKSQLKTNIMLANATGI